MKWCILFFTFYFFNFSNGQIKDEVYRLGQFDKLMSNIQNDEQLQFERLIAFHFHNKINEHRAGRRLPSLFWDDGLWLAARNHCVYMQTGNFSHGENPKHQNYTGSQPINRAYYTTYGGIGTSTVGENIVMTTSYGSNDEENALIIANECFDIWMNSRPHNEGMLDPDYYAHGTAFTISDGDVYGASVFIGKPKHFQPDEIDLNWDLNLKSKHEIFFKAHSDPSPLPIFDLKLEESKIYFAIHGFLTERNIKIEKAAQKATISHMIYMLENETYDLIEEKGEKGYLKTTTEKRFKKSGKSKYRGSKFQLKEVIYNANFNKNQLESFEAHETVRSEFSEMIRDFSNVLAWGGNAQLIEKSKNQYQCIVDVIIILSKK